MSTGQRGFTLIELTIVLSLLGLLFTLLTPWRSYWQYQKYREAERGLEAAIAALEAHLLLYRGLPPCPANDTGTEDCSKTAGELPWRTLGLPRYDPWQRPWRYQVTNNVITGKEISVQTISDIHLTVMDAEENTTLISAENLAAIVWHTGAKADSENANSELRISKTLLPSSDHDNRARWLTMATVKNQLAKQGVLTTTMK